jgi:hypothetical protein
MNKLKTFLLSWICFGILAGVMQQIADKGSGGLKLALIYGFSFGLPSTIFYTINFSNKKGEDKK